MRKIDGKKILDFARKYKDQLVEQGELEKRAKFEREVDRLVTHYKADLEAMKKLKEILPKKGDGK
jgi:hypothetical protein